MRRGRRYDSRENSGITQSEAGSPTTVYGWWYRDGDGEDSDKGFSSSDLISEFCLFLLMLGF